MSRHEVEALPLLSLGVLREAKPLGRRIVARKGRKMRPVVYIASPYTKGDVAVNVRESFVVADKLANMGYLPFPPLFSHFWHFLIPHPYNFWTALDLEWILHCDCVLRMPGESTGADDEVGFAAKHNIPVYYSIEELAAAQQITPPDKGTKRP